MHHRPYAIHHRTYTIHHRPYSQRLRSRQLQRVHSSAAAALSGAPAPIAHGGGHRQSSSRSEARPTVRVPTPEPHMRHHRPTADDARHVRQASHPPPATRAAACGLPRPRRPLRFASAATAARRRPWTKVIAARLCCSCCPLLRSGCACVRNGDPTHHEGIGEDLSGAHARSLAADAVAARRLPLFRTGRSPPSCAPGALLPSVA